MVEEMLRCSKCGQLYVARPNAPGKHELCSRCAKPDVPTPHAAQPNASSRARAVPPTVNSPPSGSMSPWWSEVAGPATTPPTVISVPIAQLPQTQTPPQTKPTDLDIDPSLWQHSGPVQAQPGPEGFSRNALIVMWSCVGAFALSLACFLALYTHLHDQSKITAANDRISQAVTAANQWIGSDSPVDGDLAEQWLADAIAEQDATEKTRGEAVLAQVRKQRKHLAELAERRRKANWDVSERVSQAEMDFSSDRLEAAEEKLAAALRVQDATDTAKAKELLSKIPVRCQELASQKVAKLATEATESFKAGQLDKALELANEALAVKGATNTGDAEQLIGRMGEAQPELLRRDAQRALEQRRYPVAARRLKAYLANASSDEIKPYLANPYSDEFKAYLANPSSDENKKARALRMVAILEIVIDSGVSQKVANLLTDKEIEALLQEGKLPDLLTPTDAALAQAVKVALTENASKERKPSPS